VASGIPDNVAQFIGDHISSLEQLEVLLLLAASGPREWDGGSVARELRIDPNSAAGRLEDLAARGLVVERSGRYRFEPASQELADVVRLLAETYAERRVSVITLIFSKPSDTIRSFSDAFKFRKDD
jgi:hypothetical protein